MYPTLYDAFLDLFGLNIPFLKIVMTFGFFVALAFLAANWVMILELKRKEKQGVLSAFQKKIEATNPVVEYFTNALIGFLIGWKLVYLASNFSALSDNPQEFLLSGQGSILWGAILALVFIVFKYFQLKNNPRSLEETTVLFHPYQMMGNLTMIAAVAGFAGAKVFHHLETWQEFIKNPAVIFTDPFSGLTFYGGLICGGAAVLWYAKKHNVHWRHMLDVGGPAMMLAYGIGRMGCHFSGDGDWGVTNIAPKPSSLSWLPDWAWAYDYPNNVLGRVLEDPVWPTPLYEVFMALALFGVLWAIRKKIQFPGVLFSIYLIFSGVERYFIEKIRVNEKYHALGMEFTQATMISVFFIVLGIAGILYFRKNKLDTKTES